jgi:hypothetical protein
MVVPLVTSYHPFYFRIFPYKPSTYWGTTMFGNLHVDYNYTTPL